jgi:hypothetical protein
LLNAAKVKYARAFRQADLVHGKVERQLSGLRELVSHKRFQNMVLDHDRVLVDDFSELPPDEQLGVIRDWFGIDGFPTEPVKMKDVTHDGFCLFMPRVGRKYHLSYRVTVDLRTLKLVVHTGLRRFSTEGTLEVGASVYPRPPKEHDNLRYSPLTRTWVAKFDERGCPTYDSSALLAAKFGAHLSRPTADVLLNLCDARD